MKKVFVVIMCFISLTLYITGAENGDHNGNTDTIDYFHIRPIPVPKEVGAPLCIYWEFSIRNPEKIELFHKTAEKTLRIYVKESDLPTHFIFNSWKDAGLTHCPFNHQGKRVKSALYFYKIKFAESDSILTRTFMINKE